MIRNKREELAMNTAERERERERERGQKYGKNILLYH
jgi:hypothetical protein